MILTNNEEYLVELQDLCKLFGEEDINISHAEIRKGNDLQDTFKVEYKGRERVYFYKYSLPQKISPLQDKSLRKRQVKNYLYQILSTLLNKTLPWGSLTGVRPTKFARDLMERGEVKDYLLADVLEKQYFLSKDRARLVPMIIKNQKGVIRNDNIVDLYINIPICPSRCLYCSFISSELSRIAGRVDEYIDAMIKEIDCVKEIVRDRALIVRNIYIGGGTPSVLSPNQLDRLLKNLNFPVNEFTVECGRPDTITAEKLDVLKNHHVTRISINPQTFCEATLKRIGRKQKNSQVLEAYSLALERGFIVNMDVIAGLPGEKFGIFKRTISTLLELYPNNITVHTLSVKNGAKLRDDEEALKNKNEREVEKMVAYSQQMLIANGYKPYYLYRQKNQLAGLENVGYYRDNDVCMFNIESMEDLVTVIGVGAGAMSKRVFNLENRIEREPNCKFIEDYISRIDEIIQKKKNFYK